MTTTGHTSSLPPGPSITINNQHFDFDDISSSISSSMYHHHPITTCIMMPDDHQGYDDQHDHHDGDVDHQNIAKFQKTKFVDSDFQHYSQQQQQQQNILEPLSSTSLIHHATSNGHVDLVEKLVTKDKVDIDSLDQVNEIIMIIFIIDLDVIINIIIPIPQKLGPEHSTIDCRLFG